MRPPEFTGGNGPALVPLRPRPHASMRPPEFTGGNFRGQADAAGDDERFNEAAGIHRRKLRPYGRSLATTRRFNEAAGIHRRKRAPDQRLRFMRHHGFNEAAGIHRRKPASRWRRLPSTAVLLQ